jgi:ribA/ribD-fused uncharacterized protein
MSEELVEKTKTHDEKNIKGFFFPYRWLSNFHICDIDYDGHKFTSTEAAYMSAKTLDKKIKEQFQHLSPKEARKRGRGIELRPDWDIIRIQVMYDVNKIKFQDLELRQKLLDTGDKFIEETNWWKDQFWGVYNGVGENNLGKILMRIREELKNEA